MTRKRLITIAHSPDSDDAFMFYALKHKKIMSPNYKFEIHRRDIEELNRLAVDCVYDVTALSVHAYAYLHDKYALTSSGASMAEKDYGPLLVSKKKYARADLKHLTVAVPGEWTTAFLVLKIIEPAIKHMAMPFHQILSAVSQGSADAGLIIHEGQLQYEGLGFYKVLSLIDEWNRMSGGLPLPLGGSAVKKALGMTAVREIADLQKKSIVYAMDHPDEAREYARSFKRDLTMAEADKYLSWYANQRSVDMGPEGIRAIDFLFEIAFKKGLIPAKVSVETV
ncbi:MAG: ABC transporter substrate-binding protein [Deltaproteobacteria bacterium]|nr:ABC transporter substrate-binding protein [Deltaproteobacteria bacterium]